jgi:hypothetical protein
VLIQREGVYKGSPAGSAEELGYKRLRLGEAGTANGNARYILQRLLANPALVWKDNVEKSLGKRLNAGSQGFLPPASWCYYGASRETREDTPPLNREYTT